MRHGFHHYFGRKDSNVTMVSKMDLSSLYDIVLTVVGLDAWFALDFLWNMVSPFCIYTYYCRNCQSQLPVNGVRCKKPPEPIEMEKRYENYIQRETKKNWKFWIVSFSEYVIQVSMYLM